MGQDKTPDERIVITGMGLVSPLGATVSGAWVRCIRGDSGIGPCTRFDTRGYRCGSAGLVPAYQLENLRAPKNQKFLNAGARHLVQASQDALASSGIQNSRPAPERVAVHVGSGRVGPEPNEFFRAFEVAHTREGTPDWDQLGGRASRLIDPYFPLRTLSNSGAALLAMEICARGPSSNFVQADIASALALDAACRDLANGRCDLAIAGGFDCLVTPGCYLSFDQRGLLSPAPPDQALRPFDHAADGIVLGEGAAALVLERLSDARRRSADIFAEIGGFASSISGGPTVEGFPDSDTISANVRRAVNGEPIDFLVASGLGIPACDRTEATIHSELFDNHLPVTAFKGLTSYLGAATALVEITLGVMALRNHLIPPVAHHRQRADGVNINVLTRSIPLDPGKPHSALLLSNSWTGQSAAVYVRNVT
jgi:3-oxoacyl-[acyl-carrier-protein] synthase II